MPDNMNPLRPEAHNRAGKFIPKRPSMLPSTHKDRPPILNTGIFADLPEKIQSMLFKLTPSEKAFLIAYLKGSPKNLKLEAAKINLQARPALIREDSTQGKRIEELALEYSPKELINYVEEHFANDKITTLLPNAQIQLHLDRKSFLTEFNKFKNEDGDKILRSFLGTGLEESTKKIQTLFNAMVLNLFRQEAKTTL